MKNQIKSTRVIAVVILAVFLLMIAFQTLSASATSTSSLLIAQSHVLFSDEFNGNSLDQTKWGIYKGTPIVSSGWLTLQGADIQTVPTFTHSILQGVIQSSDWKPQDKFTDSSFGYEIWEGSDGMCHYGVIFKASGQLGLLRSTPLTNNQCMSQSLGITDRLPSDPYYQDFIPIPNWNMITATGRVAFTLTWSNRVTLEVSNGLLTEHVYTDTSPAIPTVPLKIRLYAHTFISQDITETYAIDFVRLYPFYTIYLPILLRQ